MPEHGAQRVFAAIMVAHTGEMTQRGVQKLKVHPQLQMVAAPDSSTRWACLALHDNHWQLVVKNHGEDKCELLHTDADIALLCAGKSTGEAARYGVERHLGEQGIVLVTDVLMQGVGDEGSLECKTTEAARIVRDGTEVHEEGMMATVGVWRDELDPKKARPKREEQLPYGVAAPKQGRTRSVRAWAWVSGDGQLVTATPLCVAKADSNTCLC